MIRIDLNILNYKKRTKIDKSILMKNILQFKRICRLRKLWKLLSFVCSALLFVLEFYLVFLLTP